MMGEITIFLNKNIIFHKSSLTNQFVGDAGSMI